MVAIARDAGVVISLALQHGVAVESIGHAITAWYLVHRH